jgi:pre-rRNA-processing protein TSR3
MHLLIVQDFKENRRKCTLTPLEGRSGIEFLRLGHPARSPDGVDLPSGILLDLQGPSLKREDRTLCSTRTLILVDSTWARVPKVLARTKAASGSQLYLRSLPSCFRTAYPRASKLFEDPPTGLASVEAAFAATALLGEPRFDLLESYRWAREFLELNVEAFQQLGVEISRDGWHRALRTRSR